MADDLDKCGDRERFAEITTTSEVLSELASAMVDDGTIDEDPDDPELTNVRADLHDLWDHLKTDELTRKALTADELKIVDLIPENPFVVERQGNNSADGLIFLDLLWSAAQSGVAEATTEVVKATLVALWTKHVLEHIEINERTVRSKVNPETDNDRAS